MLVETPVDATDAAQAAILASGIAHLLRRWRFRLDTEALLQQQVHEVLLGGGFAAARELRLGPGDRIDVFVGPPDGPGVGVEAKVKGQRRAIHRQCERYCGYDRIGALVLVTNLPIGFPETLQGKPVSVVTLGQGWL